MKFNIIPPVKKCLSVLESAGFEAYIVGGAVRDFLLGITPDDYDITTNALPIDVKSLFKKTIPTGEKHGTVTVIMDNIPIEVTTYRVDESYTDMRHPDSVKFSRKLTDDLSRRDFTVNALAYNGKNFVDMFGGQNDLHKKLIRTVGDPYKRFSEDALRILRAYRFASVLDFKIDEVTESAAIKLSDKLSAVSAERIFSELSKAICGKNADIIARLLSSNVPQFLRIDSSCNLSLNKLSNNTAIRYAAFCLSANKNPQQLLSDLKAPNKLIFETTNIFDILTDKPPETKYDFKKRFSTVDINIWHSVIDAYSFANHANTENMKIWADEIISNNEAYSLSMLKIDGETLKSLGFEGKEIGTILQFLLDKVMSDETLNTENKLIPIAKSLRNS